MASKSTINTGQPIAKDNYKWIALSNTTLAALLGAINASSVILALPVIFRGIGINPLAPEGSNYLLWLLMGYMLVIAVSVVTLGRLGDMFGRTRIYNLGFAIFTVGSLLCAITWSTGSAGAIELILFRVVQAVGSACLISNSAAILTDAFPENQRGMALGLNQVAFIGGTFLGILVGGLLAEVGWQWVFLFNVPIGIAGTIWAYVKLRETGTRKSEPIDWWGNLTFAVGLTMLLTGVIYGINPSSSSLMSWTTPFVLSMLVGGIALLITFVFIERFVPAPMFRINLFRIRAFATGNIALFLAALARGGFMLMLTIWLQGIWLPLHGYDFEVTPLWAGIYMIPTSLGFLIAGPLSGWLSDRLGARLLATGGMVLAALTFLLLLFLPVDFAYPLFAIVIFLNGISMGMFIAPNTAAIMNSVPQRHRGASSGMMATLNNVGMPLSMGIFFSLIIVGMNGSVPTVMYTQLVQHNVPAQIAKSLASAPPVGYLFAAFLGYNPLGALIPTDVLHTLPPEQATAITSRIFFPQLISESFHQGLIQVFVFSCVMCAIAAGISWLRGGKYVYHEDEQEPTSCDSDMSSSQNQDS
jgi:EmrB/QacA subfamily drug resistance transporter